VYQQSIESPVINRRYAKSTGAAQRSQRSRDIVLWGNGEVQLALAKFQHCAKMVESGVAGRPPKFPLGASLAFSNWRAA
jgi:hypothetical protein